MNKITINNQKFEEINASIPLTEWVWYQNKWYKPVEQFKVGDWVYCNNSKSIFKYTIYVNDLKRLRKATSQEILEHLRTIAKEKGLVKGAKVKGIQSNSELLLHTIVQEDDNYYPETDEYAKSGIILYSNGKWAEKVEEVKDYEILSFIGTSEKIEYKGRIVYKELENYYRERSIYDRISINKMTVEQILDSKKWKIHSVKDLTNGNVYTIGDKVEYQNTPYILNNIVLKNNTLQIDLNGMCVMLSLTDIKTYKPKFTFGGHEVSFKIADKDKFFHKTVEVTCKNTTGTHTQIEEILKNYFRPCKFGNVEVKSFSFKTHVHHKNESIQVFSELETINKIDKITIGCNTGTYRELYNIYQHCLTLLK